MARVLIAEDEPALLVTYVELVEELGHECLQASDGLEALDLVRSARPDLVIADNMMPRLTGIELIRAIADDPALAKLPVVLMSAGRIAEHERALCWRFLQKPVSLEDFEHAVREGLAHAGKERLDSFVPGPVSEVSELSLAREEMLSWVSHEIKTPLSAAVTATQLALRKLRSGEKRAAGPRSGARGRDAIEPPAGVRERERDLEERLVLIARQLARMDELVTSILDAAQLHDGKLKLELEQVKLGPLLRELVAFWKETHPDYALTLSDGADIVVHADRERLRQILDNLISNAIKYGRPAREVEIAVRVEEQAVGIMVTDHGPGIPAEELPNLFDRFHRVPGQGGRGHGLGLYVASALARLQRGELSVRSSPGEGSTFTLILPRLPASAPTSADASTGRSGCLAE